MASFEFDIPNDIFGKLMECNSEEMCLEALDSSAPYLVTSLKSSLSSHKDTGELQASIKAKKAKLCKNGAYIVNVLPTGYSSSKTFKRATKKAVKRYDVSNAAKLIWLEYGTSKQAATPVLGMAVKNSESAVLKKIEDVYYKHIGAE